MEERQVKVIVETGTARNGIHNFVGDGGSTIIFNDWVKNHPGASFYSVDNNPGAIQEAKNAIGKNPSTHLVCNDSIEFLAQFGQDIDFLYLDSYDFEFWNPTPSQEHHLKEIIAALPYLTSNTVIMIDDCDLPHGGKGGLVIPFLLEQGWSIYAESYQVIFIQE